MHALLPDERGQRLLVGRDAELAQVVQKLQRGKIVCLDGHVGIGKTSLVNVGAKRCLDLFTAGSSSQLLLPLNEVLQLSKTDTIDAFCASTLRKVAAALMRYRETIPRNDISLSAGQDLAAWLSSPVAHHVNESLGASFSAGVPGVLASGLTVGQTQSAQMNTSAGFAQQGFEDMVKAWLAEIFGPGRNPGGVVCVIDNLEILESASEARNFLDVLRDRLLIQPGLRWVLCGASGVINSLAASARLRSFLSHPTLKIDNVSPAYVEPLLRARLKEFSDEPDESERLLPVALEDLKNLYVILNFNLRDLMQYADQYTEHMAAIGQVNLSHEQRRERFRKWLMRESEETYRALAGRLHKDAWNILDTAMSDEFKGTFGLGNYKQFNSQTSVTMDNKKYKSYLKNLVKFGLLTKSIDENDDEDDSLDRGIYRVSAKGAMIHYARIVLGERQSYGSVDWLKTVSY